MTPRHRAPRNTEILTDLPSPAVDPARFGAPRVPLARQTTCPAILRTGRFEYVKTVAQLRILCRAAAPADDCVRLTNDRHRLTGCFSVAARLFSGVPQGKPADPSVFLAKVDSRLIPALGAILCHPGVASLPD